MLIRSQDKEALINFNNSIVVNTMVDIGGVTKMFCSYSCDDYVIGHYSSKEKAVYCTDCKRSIYGEYHDCDINMESGGKYLRGDCECHCKVFLEE